VTDEEFEYYIKNIWHWDYTITSIEYHAPSLSGSMPEGFLVGTITWEPMSQEAIQYIDDYLDGCMYINFGYHHLTKARGDNARKTWYQHFTDRPDMHFVGYGSRWSGSGPNYNFNWSLCMDDHWLETGPDNPGGIHSGEIWDMGHYEISTTNLQSSGSILFDFSKIFIMSVRSMSQRYYDRLYSWYLNQAGIYYPYKNTYKHYFALFGWFGNGGDYNYSRGKTLQFMTCPKVNLYTYNNY